MPFCVNIFMEIGVSLRFCAEVETWKRLERILEESLVGGEVCEVFTDFADISPGQIFVEAMTTALKSAYVALAVIGRHWIVTDGVRRLDAPADPVRVELRTAIATKVPLIAVLVDRGVLPSASELPADIRGVTTAKTVQLRDDTLDVDMGRLLSTIASSRETLGPAASACRNSADQGSGWFTSGDLYNVHVDGKKGGRARLRQGADRTRTSARQAFGEAATRIARVRASRGNTSALRGRGLEVNLGSARVPACDFRRPAGKLGVLLSQPTGPFPGLPAAQGWSNNGSTCLRVDDPRALKIRIAKLASPAAVSPNRAKRSA